MKTYIIVTTSFSAIHAWPDCPYPEMAYLKNPHRHVFHLTLKKEVKHHDREVEFIRLKNQVNEWTRYVWEQTDIGSKSCEMIAKEFLHKFEMDHVRVTEDNENGAEIYR